MSEIRNSMWSIKELGIAFIICITIVAGTFSSIAMYLAFALAIAAIVLITEEDAICFMMMIMPFANIFKTSPGAQSFFTYLILFIIFWHFVKHHYIHTDYLKVLVFLVVYLAVQMIISVNILRTIKFVANLILIYLAVKSCDSAGMKKVCLFYILGMVLSSSVAALNIIPNLNDYIGTNDVRVEYEQISRFAGMYPDPNYYSINVIISLCLIVILNYKKELSAVPTMFLGSLLVMFAILTVSKSAFLMLLWPLVLLLYAKVKTRKYFVVLCVIIGCVVTASEVFAGNIEIFNDVLYRLDQASDANSLTTGRSNIWLEYLSYLVTNPRALLFGSGFGAGLVNSHAAHNTYIDMLYYLGLIGSVLLAHIFKAISNIRENPVGRNLLNYSIWICIAAMYFFLSELFYFDWAFHIIVAIGISKMNMTQARGEI